MLAIVLRPLQSGRGDSCECFMFLDIHINVGYVLQGPRSTDPINLKALQSGQADTENHASNFFHCTRTVRYRRGSSCGVWPIRYYVDPWIIRRGTCCQRRCGFPSRVPLSRCRTTHGKFVHEDYDGLKNWIFQVFIIPIKVGIHEPIKSNWNLIGLILVLVLNQSGSNFGSRFWPIRFQFWFSSDGCD